MDIEGILAITFIFGGGTRFLLAVSPVGKALADRIRHDVSELQERVDFAERLLADKRSDGHLPGGARS